MHFCARVRVGGEFGLLQPIEVICNIKRIKSFEEIVSVGWFKEVVHTVRNRREMNKSSGQDERKEAEKVTKVNGTADRIRNKVTLHSSIISSLFLCRFFLFCV